MHFFYRHELDNERNKFLKAFKTLMYLESSITFLAFYNAVLSNSAGKSWPWAVVLKLGRTREQLMVAVGTNIHTLKIKYQS